MCGIYGFVSRCGGGFDGRVFRAAAAAASSRGPDSCGVAALVAGSVVVRRRPGPLAAHPSLFDGLEGAAAVFGHGRLATCGGFGLGDAQPVRRGSSALVHNGVVAGHAAIAAARGWPLETGCDSELLAAAAEGGEGGAAARLAFALSFLAADAPYAVLGVVAGVAVASRRGLPLYADRRACGWYFGSRRFSDGCVPLAEGAVLAFPDFG